MKRKASKKKATKKVAKKRVNGRAKGQAAERKLAKLFSNWWGSEFARTPLSGGFATAKFREDWNAAGDLVTPDPTFPFCVESKKVEGWNLEQLLTSDRTLIHKWWAQTVKETPEGKIPLLVFTKNRAPLFAMMREDETVHLFLEMVSKVSLRYRIEPDNLIIFPLGDLFKTAKDSWIWMPYNGSDEE